MTTEAILETVVIVAALLIAAKRTNGMIHGIDPDSRMLKGEAILFKGVIAPEATVLQTPTHDPDLVPPTQVEALALTRAEVLGQGTFFLCCLSERYLIHKFIHVKRYQFSRSGSGSPRRKADRKSRRADAKKATNPKQLTNDLKKKIESLRTKNMAGNKGLPGRQISDVSLKKAGLDNSGDKTGKKKK